MKRVYMFWRRVTLFLGIVYRIDQSETRMRPRLAWEVAGIIWPQESERPE